VHEETQAVGMARTTTGAFSLMSSSKKISSQLKCERTSLAWFEAQLMKLMFAYKTE
jgi:hypothetical protein